MQPIMRGILLAIMSFVSLGTALAAPTTVTIDDRGTTRAFPDHIIFTAHLQSSAPIERVVLEYGVDKRTCGSIIAKAFPDFEASTSTDVSWTWDMRKSGSQPPGTTIWYRWRVTDATGNEQVSPQQQVVWLDNEHTWQHVQRGLVTLHWYEEPQSFADDLLQTAESALARLATTTGLQAQAPIDVYIYGDNEAMREAILYEPGWTGGLAYPDSGIVIIGINPDNLEWGRATIAHELTHLLVGELTFSCLSSVPTWLNEGIAVYGEGGLDDASQATLQTAIAQNSLVSVRALSGGFSEHPDKADLSYAQSYSLVNFLIEEFGQAKLLKLFANLRDGYATQAALLDAYGFGLDGLEQRWRSSIGAQPLAERGPAAVTPVPTAVPTYQPIDAAAAASVVTPVLTAVPTATVVTPIATTPTVAELASPTPVAAGFATSPATEDPTPTRASLLPIIAILVCVAGLLIYGIVMVRKFLL